MKRFWFEENPAKIKNPKKFIAEVLGLHWKDLIGEGGVSICQYVGLIKNKKIKQKFLMAIDEMLADEKTEKWIKEELEIAKKCLAADPNADCLKQAVGEEEFKKMIEKTKKERKN